MKTSQHQIGTLKFDRMQHGYLTAWDKCKIWNFTVLNRSYIITHNILNQHFVNSVHEHFTGTATDSHLYTSHRSANLNHENFTA